MADDNLTPRISIVLPTYNRAAVIGRSIRSVLAQTYSDFELIVIDDGSTDDTASIVRRFHDSRIIFVRLQNNTGAGAARNVGIRMSRGKFVSFQDSDDEWLPAKLAKQLPLLERGSPKLGIVYSDMQWISRDGRAAYCTSPIMVPNRLINPLTRSYQLHGLGLVSSLIRRECFDVVGYFNEDLPSYEDLEFFIRLARHYDFRHIEMPLINYYESDGRSADVRAHWRARQILLRLYGKELSAENPLFWINEWLRWWRANARYLIRRRILDPLLGRS